MDAGHAFKAYWRDSALVEDVNLGEIPDAEQRAIEVYNVANVQGSNDLFRERGSELMYFAHDVLLIPIRNVTGGGDDGASASGGPALGVNGHRVLSDVGVSVFDVHGET
jgi:hypothetical protein